MQGSIAERFEAKYVAEPSCGCWLWIAATKGRGYGHMKVNGKMVGAHRISYELYIGDLNNGDNVLHRCDNMKCVNPDHLFSGSCADNTRDMIAKGRVSLGEKLKQSKVSSKNVIEIRQLYKTGRYSHRKIGDMFGISKSQAGGIIRGDYWKHIQQD